MVEVPLSRAISLLLIAFFVGCVLQIVQMVRAYYALRCDDWNYYCAWLADHNNLLAIVFLTVLALFTLVPGVWLLKRGG